MMQQHYRFISPNFTGYRTAAKQNADVDAVNNNVAVGLVPFPGIRPSQ